MQATTQRSVLPNTLRTKLLKLKEPLDKMEQTAVIYKIDACILKQTMLEKQEIGDALNHHEKSQICMHLVKNDQQFAFSNARLFSHDNTKGYRLMREA